MKIASTDGVSRSVSLSDDCAGSSHVPAALPELIHHQRDQRSREGQQVIDGSKDDQRWQKLSGGEVRPEEHHHEPLEHANPAGNVADHAEQDGDEENAQELQERKR